jgi:hypothetical protein
VFKSSTAAPSRWQGPSPQKTRAERESCAMSEPIVPLWLAECCDDAILPHLIGYTSSASIPQHSQRSRNRKPPDSDLDAIYHHRTGAGASKRLEDQSSGPSPEL